MCSNAARLHCARCRLVYFVLQISFKRQEDSTSTINSWTEDVREMVPEHFTHSNEITISEHFVFAGISVQLWVVHGLRLPSWRRKWPLHNRPFTKSKTPLKQPSRYCASFLKIGIWFASPLCLYVSTECFEISKVIACVRIQRVKMKRISVPNSLNALILDAT